MSSSIATNDLWNPRVQQQTYRKILNAVCYPGSRERIDKESGILSVLACLADRISTVHDRDKLIPEWERNLLGSRFTSLEESQFVVADGSIPPAADWTPPLGSLESPELGATLLLDCSRPSKCDLTVEMKGPGIQRSVLENISGLDQTWLKMRESWIRDFPKGVDLVLVGTEEMMAWPRTAKIETR